MPLLTAHAAPAADENLPMLTVCEARVLRTLVGEDMVARGIPFALHDHHVETDRYDLSLRDIAIACRAVESSTWRCTVHAHLDEQLADGACIPAFDHAAAEAAVLA